MRKSDPTVTARFIRRRSAICPKIGLILGSGFAATAEAMNVTAEFPFASLPGFPVGSVSGHQQRFLLGTCQNVAVAVLQGRAHYYEGFDLAQITFPVRVLAEVGVEILLVTNAAGSLNPRFRVGDFMVITDHLNFLGANPLRGPISGVASPFVDLTQAYDPALQSALRAAAKSVGARCHSGVYLAVSGPSYETPAEIRAFRKWGADAVGMSTVPEVIVARQLGLRVAGLSCLTNAAAGLGARNRSVTHDDVLEIGRQRSEVARQLVERFIRAVG
ncbi:MAG TPA: purine-nucleoside phosphorylase [Verrucomicrobiales bacterium]|nr:purine-nucleoside phosphorylase [Verrucomicrobiales bacterium]